VDTNIWLDFYRSQTEAGLTLLRHLNNISDRIIVTFQVGMEFNKNRQAVIWESIQKLQSPGRISRPGLFSDAKEIKALENNHKRMEELIKRIRSRFSKILENPVAKDPVYKVCQRVFNKDDVLNLRREDNARHTIERKAFKRFLLGYPPRKSGDTSIGDALNWEWMVHCVKEPKSNLIIVSRDSDYGIRSGDKAYLNDYLKHEFRERVSKQRTIQLYAKLSDALSIFEYQSLKRKKRKKTG
jgi:hypothetical protein